MNDVRLGVNIDHIATLRQARGEDYPSLVEGARRVLDAGADQITIHLREDRRHIQDFDVTAIKLVTERYGVPLNLEMGANEDILAIAISTKPEWVCLVPEKREEKTTEGGLDLLSKDNFEKIQSAMRKLKENNSKVKISLFVEADEEILKKCVQLKADAVEIHTGDYAIDFNQGRDLKKHLEKFKNAYRFIQENAPLIGFHAGHGLTDESVIPLIKLDIFKEYNIGHWIICNAVFNGLSNTVEKLNKIVKG